MIFNWRKHVLERLPGLWGFSEALKMQVLLAVPWDLVRFPPPGMFFPNTQN